MLSAVYQMAVGRMPLLLGSCRRLTGAAGARRSLAPGCPVPAPCGAALLRSAGGGRSLPTRRPGGSSRTEAPGRVRRGLQLAREARRAARDEANGGRALLARVVGDG